MLEAEWLASDSPQVLLAWLQSPMSDTDPQHGYTGGFGGCDRPRKLTCLLEAWGSPLCGDERWCLGSLSGGTALEYELHQCVINITTKYQPMAANLLREIVGNPFRPVTPLYCACPTCLRDGRLPGRQPWAANTKCPACEDTGKRPIVPWLTPLVLAMTQAIYSDRAFGDLPILADALLDAGCPETVTCPNCNGENIWESLPDRMVNCRTCDATGRVPNPLLAHLRIGPTDRHAPSCGTLYRGCAPDCPKALWERNGPHVRGCWAVDLLLGLE